MWWTRRTMPALLLASSLAIPPIAAHAAAAPAPSPPPAPIGYNLFTNLTLCPGLPVGQQCTHTSPAQVTLLLDLTDIPCCSPAGGMIGHPVSLTLQCVHYTTAGGVTTVQLGVAAVDPYNPIGSFTRLSTAGILSPDTPATWASDTRSLAFIAGQGNYTVPNVSDSFSLSALETVDNTRNTGTAGMLVATVTGTMLNYSYSAGKYRFTGYSNGSLTCAAHPVPARNGQFWGAFNQVA